MAYFSFNKITPAAPNDPVVNEATQLNANWDHLDLKLQPYMLGGTISNIETGQEFFSTGFNFAVHNGTTTVNPDDIDGAWSAWTNIPMLSPRVIRTGFQPKWRNNSLLRQVQLSGGVQFNAAADPWTLGGTFTINSDTSGAIPASMVPVGGKHVGHGATGLTSGTSIVSGAMVSIDKPGGNTFCRIFVQYMGGAGGGNFIQLEQVWWWY